MSSESASNSTSNVPVSDAAQESKDNLRLQQPSPQLYPANQNPVNKDLEAMVSGSDFLLLNGKDLARVWDQVDSMKAAIEELRSKIEENGTLKAVQSELAILREKLCESIDKLGSKLESNGQTASAGSQGGHPRKSSVVPTSMAESESPTSIQRNLHIKPSAKDESHNFFEGGIPENCKFEDLIRFLRKTLDRSPLSEEESQSLIIQLENIFRSQEDKSLELQKECEQAKSQVELSKMEHAEIQSSLEEEKNLKSQLKSLQEEKLRVESEFKEKEDQLQRQLQEVNLKMESEMHMKDLECKGLKEHNESLKLFVNVFDKTIDRVPKSAEEPLKFLAQQELSKVNVAGVSDVNVNNTATGTGETSSLDSVIPSELK